MLEKRVDLLADKNCNNTVVINAYLRCVSIVADDVKPELMLNVVQVSLFYIFSFILAKWRTLRPSRVKVCWKNVFTSFAHYFV